MVHVESTVLVCISLLLFSCSSSNTELSPAEAATELYANRVKLAETMVMGTPETKNRIALAIEQTQTTQAISTDTVTSPTTAVESTEGVTLNFEQLWSYGLTSRRTGEPLIRKGAEHNLDKHLISYGYNLIVDETGNQVPPSGRPLQGGEQLTLTSRYRENHNTREFALIYTLMAPIRDTLLYHFEETSKEDWTALTQVLTINGIKTSTATEINGHSILSTEQVYDYIARGQAEGDPVMRYLEEAGLELKCLAFQDFDFTNPEGTNHCEENHFDLGSGIQLP